MDLQWNMIKAQAYLFVFGGGGWDNDTAVGVSGVYWLGEEK